MGETRSLEASDILDVLRERDRREYPVMSATDIHGELEDMGFDVTRRTVKYRLETARDTPDIRHRKAGNTPVYWLPSDFPPDETEETRVTPEPDTDASPISDGATPAEGELANVVEGINDIREASVQLDQRLEQLEGEVARLESPGGDDDPDGDDTDEVPSDFSLEAFHRTGVKGLQAAGPLALMCLGFLIAYEGVRAAAPSIFNTSIPVLGTTVGGVIILLAAISGAVAIASAAAGLPLVLLTRGVGVARKRLE